MSTPYIGECRLVGFNFAPVNWSICNGATIAISENETLFALVGTTYGGDGVQTFQIPDLQGRVPVHQGPSYVIGQRAGVENVTITTQTMPSHNHITLCGTNAGSSNSPQNNLPATNATTKLYVTTGAPDAPMNGAMIGLAGGSQPHENMQPFLVMNWIISLFGVFPTQS